VTELLTTRRALETAVRCDPCDWLAMLALADFFESQEKMGQAKRWRRKARVEQQMANLAEKDDGLMSKFISSYWPSRPMRGSLPEIPQLKWTLTMTRIMPLGVSIKLQEELSAISPRHWRWDRRGWHCGGSLVGSSNLVLEKIVLAAARRKEEGFAVRDIP
jgi:hypothetical protein